MAREDKQPPARCSNRECVYFDRALVDVVVDVPPAGYDARHINWVRLWERVIAALISVLLNGSLLVLAKALGIL